MDPVRNPFAPGAGSRPPELAGRDAIIAEADIALQRLLHGRHARSQMLLGLRGTGKTVLLNAIEELASKHKYQTSFIEAPEENSLAQLLYPRMAQALRKFSLITDAKAKAVTAMRALRSFAAAFRVTAGDISLSVDPEPGTADSGQLDFDLPDLFLSIGEAAKAAGSGWCLLIDEVQYLKLTDLSALIVAVHRVNQRGLPVVMFGAGLPQIAAISGDAKSYAERLFSYPPVGPLDHEAARAALSVPIADEGESIAEDALTSIVERTEAYPYFLQEWGYQAWNEANSSPIQLNDVADAADDAVRRLDEGFFSVRYDRLTPKEKEYVRAMAELGPGWHRTADVAAMLDERPQALGPRRAGIIQKGMIYMPEHGRIAFTVPMFDEYLKRIHPDFTPPSPPHAPPLTPT